MHRYGSIVLMLLAQLCSAILATIGRVLRTGSATGKNANAQTDAMGTSEILLAMTLLTSLLSWLVLPFLPHHPSPSPTISSPPSPRKTTFLLLLRSTAGFLGIWSFYFSLRTLPLSTASVINFVAPTLAVLLLGLFPLSRSHSASARLSPTHLLAGAVSLSGALFVLQPWSTTSSTTTGPSPADQTAYLLAVLASLSGVLGGALSFVAIAHLRDAVHPLRTVAWFSSTCVACSALLLVFQPHEIKLPTSELQWGLVLVLGVLAFAMHWAMTASLAWDGDARRPLNFVYTQIVFAMVADRAVWGVVPDAGKYVGGALIVGSAVFVARRRERGRYELVHGDEEGEEYDPLEMARGKERAEWSTESDI